MRVILKRGNDQIVSMTGLRNTKTGTYLNDATVKASLFDSKWQPLPYFQDAQMAYVPGSNGNYQWQVEGSQMMLPKGTEYSLVFTAEQGGLNYRVVHVVSIVDGDGTC